MKVKPEECLFIEDKERAVVGAQKVGMHTILFKNQKALEKRFKELGILG